MRFLVVSGNTIFFRKNCLFEMIRYVGYKCFALKDPMLLVYIWYICVCVPCHKFFVLRTFVEVYQYFDMLLLKELNFLEKRSFWDDTLSWIKMLLVKWSHSTSVCVCAPGPKFCIFRTFVEVYQFLIGYYRGSIFSEKRSF